MKYSELKVALQKAGFVEKHVCTCQSCGKRSVAPPTAVYCRRCKSEDLDYGNTQWVSADHKLIASIEESGDDDGDSPYYSYEVKTL